MKWVRTRIMWYTLLVFHLYCDSVHGMRECDKNRPFLPLLHDVTWLGNWDVILSLKRLRVELGVTKTHSSEMATMDKPKGRKDGGLQPLQKSRRVVLP